MKLLITGGAGFFGSNLAMSAERRGFDVLVFDNLSRLGATENLKWLQRLPSLKFRHGDMRSQEEVTECIKHFKPDVIAHLAAQVAMTTSIESPLNDFMINAFGTVALLEAVRRYSPRSRVLFSSTNKVYGDLERFRVVERDTRFECPDFLDGFSEDVPLCFESPYGCSKGAAEQYVLDYARLFGVAGMVFRHSSIYGGRQHSTVDQGWVGWFCKQATLQRSQLATPFNIAGSGKQVRDLLYVEDAVALYLSACVAPETAWGEAFNIGGGRRNSLSLIELFDRLERELDVKLRYVKGDARPSDQRVFISNNAKANRLLGWAPKVDLDVGLRDALDWALEA
jgi:CDP-paratose 2-epimerase